MSQRHHRQRRNQGSRLKSGLYSGLRLAHPLLVGSQETKLGKLLALQLKFYEIHSLTSQPPTCTGMTPLAHRGNLQLLAIHLVFDVKNTNNHQALDALLLSCLLVRVTDMPRREPATHEFVRTSVETCQSTWTTWPTIHDKAIENGTVLIWNVGTSIGHFMKTLVYILPVSGVFFGCLLLYLHIIRETGSSTIFP